jgi:hypothetical protein
MNTYRSSLCQEPVCLKAAHLSYYIGMMAKASRAMPNDRLSAVNIIVSTTNPDTTSRNPFKT